MQKSHFIKSEKLCLYPESKHESKGNGQRKSTTVRKQNSWCLWEAHVHVMGTNIRDIFMMKLSDRSSSPSSASLNNCTRTTWQQQKKTSSLPEHWWLFPWSLRSGKWVGYECLSRISSQFRQCTRVLGYGSLTGYSSPVIEGTTYIVLSMSRWVLETLMGCEMRPDLF